MEEEKQTNKQQNSDLNHQGIYIGKFMCSKRGKRLVRRLLPYLHAVCRLSDWFDAFRLTTDCARNAHRINMLLSFLNILFIQCVECVFAADARRRCCNHIEDYMPPARARAGARVPGPSRQRASTEWIIQLHVMDVVCAWHIWKFRCSPWQHSSEIHSIQVEIVLPVWFCYLSRVITSLLPSFSSCAYRNATKKANQYIHVMTSASSTRMDFLHSDSIFDARQMRFGSHIGLFNVD